MMRCSVGRNGWQRRSRCSCAISVSQYKTVGRDNVDLQWRGIAYTILERECEGGSARSDEGLHAEGHQDGPLDLYTQPTPAHHHGGTINMPLDGG
jgi:hypothetical protein